MTDEKPGEIRRPLRRGQRIATMQEYDAYICETNTLVESWLNGQIDREALDRRGLEIVRPVDHTVLVCPPSEAVAAEQLVGEFRAAARRLAIALSAAADLEIFPLNGDDARLARTKAFECEERREQPPGLSFRTFR